jgi:hypothetical protein
MHSPVATSHSFNVLSLDPLTTSLLSLEKQTEKTEPECPFNVLMQFPVATSHSFNELSLDPLTTNLLSLEKQTEST